MVVPYGDPSPVRFWQNYFDAGEYSMGKNTNSLELGCDCLGEIHYSDAVLADDRGHAHTITNAICIHEEDVGILFKHTDEFTGAVDVRRNRRLVISFFITVGNYDYGFYWYLYLDGTLELECKATGIVYTAAYGDEAQRQRWSSPLGDEDWACPSTSTCSAPGSTCRSTASPTPSMSRKQCAFPSVRTIPTAMPSPGSSLGSPPRVAGPPMVRLDGSGTSSIRTSPTGTVSRRL